MKDLRTGTASSNVLRHCAGAAFALVAIAFLPQPALALSEIQREDVPVPEGAESDDGEIRREDLPPPPSTEPPNEAEQVEEPGEEAPPAATPPVTGSPVPLPDPVVSPKDPTPPAAGEEPDAESDEPVPDVLYDVELLPEPVRRMRELIMEACLSGDIERLRPLISGGENGTQLSFGQTPADPVEFLLDVSGDDKGHEILAILYEVLAAGYVHVDEGQPGEMYVWPYFFAVPLKSLDDRQRVELFKLVTAGDYEDMKNYGAYIFYRIGISPEGRWLFFVAGD